MATKEEKIAELEAEWLEDMSVVLSQKLGDTVDLSQMSETELREFLAGLPEGVLDESNFEVMEKQELIAMPGIGKLGSVAKMLPTRVGVGLLTAKDLLKAKPLLKKGLIGAGVVGAIGGALEVGSKLFGSDPTEVEENTIGDFGQDEMDLAAKGIDTTDEEWIRNISWENHTIESANDKFITWFLDKGIPAALQAGTTDLSGFGSLKNFIQQTGTLTNIRTGAGRESFKAMIMENFDAMPNLRSRLGAKASELMESAASAEDIVSFLEPSQEAVLNSAEVDMWEEIFGTAEAKASPIAAPVINQMEHLDKTYGEGTANRVLAGLLEEEVDSYIDDYTAENQYMMQFGDQSMLTNFGKTYDNTPFGSINTLQDLFSGPAGLRVGPAHIGEYLYGLESRTKTPNQGSDVIAQIQQTLYSMGHMSIDGKPYTPDQWGYVDDGTVRALESFQWDLIVNYEEAQRALGGDTEVDVNGLFTMMRNRGVRNMSAAGLETAANQEQAFRMQVVDDIRTGIEDQLQQQGMSLRDGSDLLSTSIRGVLDNMSEEETNIAGGRGGSPTDVTAVDAILAQFYNGDTEWGEYLEFGNGSNQAFVDYANRVGALTEEEQDDLIRFQTGTPFVGGRDMRSEMQNTKGKEVATANFLNFLGKPLSEASKEDIHNALIIYSNTVGQKYASTTGLTPKSLSSIANKAHADIPFYDEGQDVRDLSDTLEGRVADAMRINDQGYGDARYSNLLDIGMRNWRVTEKRGGR